LINETVEVLEPWREVSLSEVSGRTQIGQMAKLGLTHGWVVKLAKTKSRTVKTRTGKSVIEEHFWLGGAKPSFDKPEKVFLINKIYMKKNMQECDLPELKKFILEN
jgi:hypothetical protein